MKQYDFDGIIERKNTNSLKFDCAALRVVLACPRRTLTQALEQLEAAVRA